MVKHQRCVALIGAGVWGRNLARNLHQLDALHTICDTHQERLDTFQYAGVHLNVDYRAVLANPEIKRVVIATPAVTHYQVAKEALLAGKDVYVEKPMCMELGESEELVVLAEQHRLVLMVGHLLQYHPCVQRLHKIVLDGQLGDLQYITSNRLALGRFFMEENALWNFAPHDISVILSLCGQLPEQVRCTGGAYLVKGVEDTIMTTLRFPGGVRAHVFVSWLNPFKEQKLTVVGSEGMVVFDDTKGWEEKLLKYPNPIKWTQEGTPQVNVHEVEKVIVTEKEPLREECAHFLHCCDQRISPQTDGKEALRVQRVLQAAQASLNEDGTAKSPIMQELMLSP